MSYDLTELDRLGQLKEQLEEQLADVKTRLHQEILDATAAGTTQKRLAEGARYQRDAIYRIWVRHGLATPAPAPHRVKRQRRADRVPA